MDSTRDMIASLTVVVDGERVCVPCFEVVLFSSSPLHAQARAHSILLSRFIECHARFLRFYATATSDRLMSTTSKRLQSRIRLSSLERHVGDTVGLFAHSGLSDRAVMPAGLDFFHDDSEPAAAHAYFRGVFPIDVAFDRTDEFVSEIVELIGDYPFSHGYAGLSYFWQVLDPWVHEAVTEQQAGLLHRHPGLGYGHPMEFAEVALQGLIGISWLTLIGKSVASSSTVARRLGRELTKLVSIQQLPGGTLLRLGDRPEIGDRNRRKTLPLYGAVGRALDPFKAPADEVWIDGMDPDSDEMESWFHRFFKR